MHKLILLLAAASVTLTGCLKNNNEPSKLEPVRAGLVIYNAGALTNQMALQTADIGIRMGMLLAEAKAQGIEDFEDISVSEVGKVQNYLFGIAPRTVIEKTKTGYKLTYNDSRGLKDDFIRKGTYVINNNGVEQLSETSQTSPWEITFEGSDPYLQFAGDVDQIHYQGGATTIYALGKNSYRIEITNISIYLQPSFVSDWSGSFTWTPAGADLTVTANLKKTSKYTGTGYGEAFYSFNNISAASMTYTVENGIMAGYRLLGSGTEICRLNSTSDYNIAEFPSPEVKLVWRDSGMAYTITYNGISVNSAE